MRAGPFFELTIVVGINPAGISSQSWVRFRSGAAETGRALGVLAAGILLFFYELAHGKLVGICVGIGSKPQQKLSWIQLVMVLGRYRPGTDTRRVRARRSGVAPEPVAKETHTNLIAPQSLAERPQRIGRR
jgi:hypothetical protein